jgi:hypothetical protein
LCEHEFEFQFAFEHPAFKILGLTVRRQKLSSYSKCKKCGILRHDNDGDLFYPEDYGVMP